MSGKLWTVNCGMKDVNWEAFPLSFRASSWISPPLWRSEDGFQAKHHDQSEGSCGVPAAQLGPKSTARNCYQRSSLNIGPPGVTWVQSHPVSQRPVCLVFEKHLKLPIMCLWRGKDCFFKKTLLCKWTHLLLFFRTVQKQHNGLWSNSPQRICLLLGHGLFQASNTFF